MGSSLELATRLSAVVNAQQEILGVITDLERVMTLVVERTPHVTSGDGALIELLEGGELVCRAASGAARQNIAFRVALDGSLSGVVVREKTVIRCDNVETDPRVDGASCRALGIRSMIVAPLIERDVAVGTLTTFSSNTSAFDDLDAHALQLLAGMTSWALLQARSFRDCEASEQRYRMLFERNVAGVFRTTVDGRILDCNDALVRYLGYDSREDLLSHPAWDLYHQRSDREWFVQLLQENKPLFNLRIPFRRKDGTSLLGIVSASLVPGDNNETQLLGTVVEG